MSDTMSADDLRGALVDRIASRHRALGLVLSEEIDRTFDAIIVTVGRGRPLAGGGRLVVPLRTKGMTRSWVLEHQGDALVSRGQQMCGFVPFPVKSLCSSFSDLSAA